MTLTRHVLDATLSIRHDGRRVVLQPVDLAHNAHQPRGKPRPEDAPTVHPPRKSSADLAFDDEFAPIVDPDGGFTDKD